MAETTYCGIMKPGPSRSVALWLMRLGWCSRMHRKPLAGVSGECKAKDGTLRHVFHLRGLNAESCLPSLQRIVSNYVGINSQSMGVSYSSQHMVNVRRLFVCVARELGYSMESISKRLNTSRSAVLRYERAVQSGQTIKLGLKEHRISDVAELVIQQYAFSAPLSTIHATNDALHASKQVQCNQSHTGH